MLFFTQTEAENKERGTERQVKKGNNQETPIKFQRNPEVLNFSDPKSEFSPHAVDLL